MIKLDGKLPLISPPDDPWEDEIDEEPKETVSRNETIPVADDSPAKVDRSEEILVFLKDVIIPQLVALKGRSERHNEMLIAQSQRLDYQKKHINSILLTIEGIVREIDDPKHKGIVTPFALRLVRRFFKHFRARLAERIREIAKNPPDDSQFWMLDWMERRSPARRLR